MIERMITYMRFVNLMIKNKIIKLRNKKSQKKITGIISDEICENDIQLKMREKVISFFFLINCC